MSHIAEVELHVKDLAVLKDACKALGLEFKENQQTFRWYGRRVGNAPLPEGFSESDLGKCQHAIGVRNDPDAYEIGIAERRDGKPGFVLLWDNWQGGFGLEAVVGKDACRLRQEYAARVSEKQLCRQGYRVHRMNAPDGRIRLVASR